MLSSGVFVAIITALAALGYSLITSSKIKKIPLSNPAVMRISGYIEEGAHAFLAREYKAVGFIIPVVAVLLLCLNSGALKLQAVSFLIGSVLSALSGWFGMSIAVKANARTAEAAQKGILPALRIAFSSGSVMGMTVVGLVLLGIGAILGLLLFMPDAEQILAQTIFPIVSGFSLGASMMALFARVGGGKIGRAHV